jgi:hypothetical protein
MIKWLDRTSPLIASFLIILPKAASASGAGRYSVDSSALSSTWMLVGILFGGYAIYSVIKHLFGKKDDDST